MASSVRCSKLPLNALLLASVLIAAPLLAAAGVPTNEAEPGQRAPATANPQRLTHGRFNDFPVYVPAGAPTSVALLLSGAEGWSTAADAIARQLAQQGAMVAGIDWGKFKANLDADTDRCVSPDGDLENLSHFVQAYFHSPTYLSPMLVGISSGSTMAYAMLAQAPRDTFAAALTRDFCPRLALEKPLCRGSGLEFKRSLHGHGVELLPSKELGNPWLDLDVEADRACPVREIKQFTSQVRGAALVTLPKVGSDHASKAAWMRALGAGYAKLAALKPTRTASPPSSLSDLPVVEVPAQAGLPATDIFALIMSGDGGWAGLDQDVAAALAAKGVPVVGLDSLRYFWTPRTPERLAADTDRLIRYYLAHFSKQRVLMIGYSQGADVLPFAVNRLPAATRARVALTAVMGMSEHALFEFHLSSWISDNNSGPATLPEINRLSGKPVLCIYGADENDSLCPKLDSKKFNIVELKGGHHFDGDYPNLAQQILKRANP
jgi:type IV secretory pathway VirJ component